MLGWMNHKIARRNINNLRLADDNTLTAENEEKLKSLLMKVKEENEKAGLKCNTQKRKVMAFGPIAAAKLLQLCPTVRPQRRQPTWLLCPWDSPGKNTGVSCHFLLQCMHAC